MGGTAWRGGDRITSFIVDEVLAELARLRTAGEACCIATVVRVDAPTSAKPGDKAVITQNGDMVGWIGGSCSEGSVRREALQALAEGEPRMVRIEPATDLATSRDGEVVLTTSCPSGGTIEIFLEPHLARPQLVVMGQSPAARAMIRLGAAIGYRTCAVHHGALPDDFPEADIVLPQLDLTAADVGKDSWIAVATMGHYDEEALEAALATDAAYVGLIASRRRRRAVVQALRRRGWSGDALAGIVNPAGRALGDSQEEIALSVLAEIVDRRNRRKIRTTRGVVAQEPVFATDPVCGMAVQIAGALYRSGGVFFCGPGCQQAFDADPERFSGAVIE